MIAKNRKYLVVLILFFMGLSIFSIWTDAKNVTVIDGTEILQTKTSLQKVGLLLQEKGYLIDEKDRVEPAITENITEAMEIRIIRARSINILEDNKITTIRTTKNLTRDVIAEAGMILGDLDKTLPELDIVCANEIIIKHVQKSVVIEEKNTAYPVETVSDNNLYSGEQRVLQKGKTGIVRSTYEVVYEDNNETSRSLIERLIIKEPVKQILALGTMQTVSRGGDTLNFKNMMDMKATGYTHTGNRTYTDVWPAVGTVAVDPRVIPLGTRLYIEGYGYATAMDIGSDIKNSRIDLFFNTRAEAMRWGVKNVRVFILS